MVYIVQNISTISTFIFFRIQPKSNEKQNLTVFAFFPFFPLSSAFFVQKKTPVKLTRLTTISVFMVFIVFIQYILNFLLFFLH